MKHMMNTQPECNSHHDKGFTLIEVLVSIVILALGLLSLATLASTVMHGNAFGKEMTVATTLAEERMEEVKRLGYANAETAAGTENYGTITNYGDHRRVTSVSASTPAAGMKTVTVTVFWGADAYSVTLSAIIT